MYPDQSRPASRFFAAESYASRELTNWNLLAPRAGLSWDVTGGARNVVKASYGRYYWNISARTLTLAVTPNNPPTWRRYRWTDTNLNGVWDSGEEGALLGTRGGVAAQDIDPSAKDTYTNQVTFWLRATTRREVRDSGRLRVEPSLTGADVPQRADASRGLHNSGAEARPGPRRQRPGTADDGKILNLLDLTPALIGQTRTVYMNVPDYNEEARNIEIVANRRFSNRWSMTASYAMTWRNDFNAVPYNPNGAPQSDLVPMTFIKLSGSYEPGWGLRLTPLVRYQSGNPYGRRASISMNYGSQTVQIEPTSDRNMEAPLVFDMRAERKFAMKRGTALSAVVDLFNITNSNAETDIVINSGSTIPVANDRAAADGSIRFGVKFG